MVLSCRQPFFPAERLLEAHADSLSWDPHARPAGFSCGLGIDPPILEFMGYPGPWRMDKLPKAGSPTNRFAIGFSMFVLIVTLPLMILVVLVLGLLG